MESAVRSYVARVLLLNLAFLAVVVVVVLLAGLALYYSARTEAENAGLERLTIPANATADTLERHFGGVVETMSLADRDPAGPRGLLREGARGGGQATTLKDVLWRQLRGRLSAMLVVNARDMSVADVRVNTPAAAADGTADPAGDPAAGLIAPTLYSSLRPGPDAQAAIAPARQWLMMVLSEGRPAVSPVVWITDGPGVGSIAQRPRGARAGVADAAVGRRPVVLIAYPIANAGATRPTLPSEPHVAVPPSTTQTSAVAEALLVGIVPVAYLEENILLAASQPNRIGLLLFDAAGRLIAGGGEAAAGTPVAELAPEAVPQALADYVERTLRGETDSRRRFDGIIQLGPISFASSMPIARAVRATGRTAIVAAGVGENTGPAPGDPDAPAPEDDSGDVPEPVVARPAQRAGQPADAPASDAPVARPAGRLLLVALLNREAAVAPLQQTARTAVVWALAMVGAMTAILVSSAVQLIRGRSRLERLRTEMMDKELREARQIQLMWLPDDEVHRTATRQIDIAAENIPASHISGDFYNYFDLPDGRCALVIGDVTGHGMSAAFLMATTQLLVRTTLQRIGDPGKTLEEVNNLLCSQAFHGQFVTIQLVVVGLKGRKLQIASAGHPPPLKRGTDGTWRPLDTEAQLVLGVLEGSEYPTQTIDLDDSESLLLYTDGVIEAKGGDGKRFSLELLAAALSKRVGTGASSARDLATETLLIVREFAGGQPLEDDLTVLAVHLSPVRPPAPQEAETATAAA